MTVNDLEDTLRHLQVEGMGDFRVVVNYGKNELANGQLATAVTQIQLLLMTETGEFKDADLEEYYKFNDDSYVKEFCINITSGSLP